MLRRGSLLWLFVMWMAYGAALATVVTATWAAAAVLFVIGTFAAVRT